MEECKLLQKKKVITPKVNTLELGNKFKKFEGDIKITEITREENEATLVIVM